MYKIGLFTCVPSRSSSVSRISPIVSFNAKQLVKPIVAIQARRYASGRTKEEETLARIEIMRAQAHLGGGLKRIETQHQKVIIQIFYYFINKFLICYFVLVMQLGKIDCTRTCRIVIGRRLF